MSLNRIKKQNTSVVSAESPGRGRHLESKQRQGVWIVL